MAGINACFAEGVRLFNQANFFEAHELWEDKWNKAEGEERIFYQGLIQAAVALCHVQRGNYAGAISVYLKSWPKLAGFPAVWMGIELEQFRGELRRYFDTLRTSSNACCGNCQSVGPGQIVSTAQPPIIRWASM